MELKDQYYHSQLEAIQNFYNTIRQDQPEEISLTDAIITWFTDGYAEAFRETFIKDNTFASQN